MRRGLGSGIGVNLKGAFLCIKRFTASMMKARYGAS